MTGWMRKVVASTGLAAVARRTLTHSGVFVLELHGVARQRYLDVPEAAQPSYTTADLERTLTWLGKRFPFLTPDQAFQPGARGVLLTFDDGFANNVEQALPLLERFGAPAIFFVTLKHVEDPLDWLPSVHRGLESVARDWGSEVDHDLFDGMSREQLGTCAAHPLITVGSHTRSHRRLTSCDDDDLRREVEGSRRRLEELTGGEVKLFAYPYGDYDLRVAQAVRDAGYLAAFVEDSRQVGAPDFEIPRVGLYGSDPGYLGLKLSGLHRRPWMGFTAGRGNHG